MHLNIIYLIDPDRTLFGQVPILIVQDGEKEFKIAQSNTIARFLGIFRIIILKTFNL